MLYDTQQKGTTTELHCILDVTNLGYRCLRPVDDSSKYDVVVDLDNGTFTRIQCKTASWVLDTQEPNAAFDISTCSTTNSSKSISRQKYSKDDIDYFYTWFNGQGYLVSIEEATGTSFRWRYDYPLTGQKKGVHIADDYKIEDILSSITE